MSSSVQFLAGASAGVAVLLATVSQSHLFSLRWTPGPPKFLGCRLTRGTDGAHPAACRGGGPRCVTFSLRALRRPPTYWLPTDPLGVRCAALDRHAQAARTTRPHRLAQTSSQPALPIRWHRPCRESSNLKFAGLTQNLGQL